MRRILQAALPIAIFALALPQSVRAESHGSPGAVFAGGDGSSCASAIVIRGVPSEIEGVSAEYRWLAEKYPRSRLGNQSLSHDDGRSFDLIELTTAAGESKTVCFDISEFYGKL